MGRINTGALVDGSRFQVDANTTTDKAVIQLNDARLEGTVETVLEVLRSCVKTIEEYLETGE
ncbi:MAG: hypothetical protein H6832_14955 [Planctomycetes bacterium]|nr:hypothetical protein [Planctomycetota bacterium]